MRQGNTGWNHDTNLLMKKDFLLLSMLKTVVLLNIFAPSAAVQWSCTSKTASSRPVPEEFAAGSYVDSV